MLAHARDRVAGIAPAPAAAPCVAAVADFVTSSCRDGDGLSLFLYFYLFFILLFFFSNCFFSDNYNNRRGTKGKSRTDGTGYIHGRQ